MLNVIKIGGNILDDEKVLFKFLEAISKLEGEKILVHGGGKIATEIGHKLGIEPNYVNGRRVTDADTLKLVTMVYAGLINKNIVAQLQSFNCNAIGLTGADGNAIIAKKRPVADVDYGFVGDVVAVNGLLLKQLLYAGITPVLVPITHDAKGGLLNTNADTIAQEVAKAMSQYMEVSLVYGFEKDGVLKDANDDSSVIPVIEVNDFDQLVADGVISGGMIPKLQNACSAIRAGVKHVIIGNALQLNNIINGEKGTIIK
ncbi:MAG TPA: acetylglutamate kinase [Flavipsychrobacter sp.]|nr:acetylglutamate kinase [Flavipsychrobacter sp.]